ncbi:MAG: DapH/DapD/GlmU-related protein, partial [Candidatus Nanoarchaeia archaeon]|nr:DapH/DapD/GlmU-related protein [Candidatus Nanoarchaeia archaeon]
FIVYPIASKVHGLINIPLLLPIIVYFSLLFYALLYTFQSFIFLKIIFNPKKKEGIFNINELNPAVLYYSLSNVIITSIEKIFSVLIVPQAFYGNLIMKLFGKKCGKGSLVNPVKDPYLVSLGNDSIIGFGAIITGHEIVGKKIFLKGIDIGDRVTIGANAIISGGAVLEDDVIVGANSYVKKNAVLKKGKFYVGCPAKIKIKKVK